jgi:hypothetical protein
VAKARILIESLTGTKCGPDFTSEGLPLHNFTMSDKKMFLTK